AGGSTTVTHALSVPTPFPNPNLAAGCGINVMLVLDKSGSIESSGATPKVKAAARAFLNALSDTGSQVAIIDFSTDAQMQVPYTAVTPDSISNVFDPYLVNKYKPSGSTNWQAAFQQVKAANAQKDPVADLVVFMTDGDPNRSTAGSARVDGAVSAMQPA